MSVVEQQQFWVNRKDYRQYRVVNAPLDSDTLTEGELLLAVDRFGFSANNITYAAMGERMGYWGFFPASQDEGIIPVWGFATVVASQHPDLRPGERLFGYLPMASHWVVKASEVTATQFVDTHPQRRSIHPVYDQYIRCAADPSYVPAQEVWQMNIRPLFMTSFVLDQYVSAERQATTIIITSASSKTALGTAFLLNHHRQSRSPYNIVGLTSSKQLDAVKASHCYDEVFSYDQVPEIAAEGMVVVLDFAANGTLLNQLQAQFASQWQGVVMIGATDWQAAERPNPATLKAELFFAPAQVQSLMTQWGSKGFMQTYAKAWQAFTERFISTMTEQQVIGSEAMATAYKATLDGDASPYVLLSLAW
jgi:hypothetical protein